ACPGHVEPSGRQRSSIACTTVRAALFPSGGLDDVALELRLYPLQRREAITFAPNSAIVHRELEQLGVAMELPWLGTTIPSNRLMVTDGAIFLTKGPSLHSLPHCAT